MKTQCTRISDTFEAVYKGQLIAVSANQRSKERSKIDTLTAKLEELKEQNKKTQNLAEDKKQLRSEQK